MHHCLLAQGDARTSRKWLVFYLVLKDGSRLEVNESDSPLLNNRDMCYPIRTRRRAATRWKGTMTKRGMIYHFEGAFGIKEG
jgi:hypothetical protein